MRISTSQFEIIDYTAFAQETELSDLNIPELADLNQSDILQIEDICAKFEQSWQQGQRPEIEKLFQGLDPIFDQVLLIELLRLELSYTQKSDEHIHLESWFSRFPNHRKLIEKIFLAANESSQPKEGMIPSNSEELSTSKKHVVSLKLSVISEGVCQGKNRTLCQKGVLLVGRGKNTDFQLPSGPSGDLRVSHRHFCIHFDPPRIWIEDVGSRLGTFVNEKKVRHADLKSGDTIRAGRTLFQIEVEESSIDQETSLFNSEQPLRTDAQTPCNEEDSRRHTCPVCLEEQSKSSKSLCQSCTDKAANQSQSLPGYILVEELGSGAMGTVYLALRRDLGHSVALKVINTNKRITTTQVARFLREAQILSRLRHKHIVCFQDQGAAHEFLYITMENIRGTDAAKVLKQKGPMEIRDATRLCIQLFKALEYAHKRNIVHRDIKPSNILIDTSRQPKVVKVADFGLSKIYQDSITQVTQPGEIGGTLAFIAPEQVKEFSTVSPAADQYSAAATLYNLLTNRTVHDLSGDVLQQLYQIENEPIIPIQDRRQDLPSELVQIIHQALSSEPTSRFPSVQHFRKALMPYAR